MSTAESGPPRKAPVIWLASGATLGLVLAALGLFQGDSASRPLPETAVARVNESLILRESYDLLLAGLESDTRSSADAAQRRHVLDRMIEEELLVQRGLELGLAGIDRRVRGDLVSAVIAAATSDAETAAPEAGELERFFEANQNYFTHAPRLRVRRLFFRNPTTAASEITTATRVEQARERLAAGEEFAGLRSELGDPALAPVPDALLPPAKLREYIGPTGLDAVVDLEPGQVSPPIPTAGGVQLLELAERDDARTPSLETIRNLVEAEWSRREAEAALRRYLEELRRRAEIRVSPELE